MAEFGCFDFKAPIGSQNDYRTSTYRGHLQQLPEHTSKPTNRDLSQIHRDFFHQIGSKEINLSESREEFSWKTQTPSIVRNPIKKEAHFVKSFEETHFPHYSNLKPPICSVTHNDYPWKSKTLEEPLPVLPFPSEADANTHLLIDTCKPSYGNLLHPSATTNNLAYRTYSQEDLNTSAKDNITYWNWKNGFEKKYTNFNIANKNYEGYRREFRKPDKFVPYNGLTTESRSNYKPISSLSAFESPYLKDKFICGAAVSHDDKSENTVYGSGLPLCRI